MNHYQVQIRKEAAYSGLTGGPNVVAVIWPCTYLFALSAARADQSCDAWPGRNQTPPTAILQGCSVSPLFDWHR